MRRRIGEILVGGKAVSAELRDRAIAQQARLRGRFCTNLLELGGIREDLLLRGLAVQHGVATCSPADLVEIRPDILRLVPGKLAGSLFVIPFRRLGRNLSIAMRDPKDLPALDEISFLTGLAISPFVALDLRVQVALAKHYGATVDPRYPELAAKIDAGGGMVAVAAPKTPKPFLRTSSAVLRPLSPDAAAPAPRPAPEPVREEAPAPSPPVPPARPDAVEPPAPPRVPNAPVVEIELGEHEERNLRSAAEASTAPDESTSAVGGEETSPLVEEEAPADLLASLSRAESRDDIAAAVLREASRLLQRAALFIAQADRVIGWAAVPEPPDGLRSFSVAFSEPSLFASLRNTDGFYVGPCPDLPGNRRVLEALGGAFPAVIAAVPVTLKGKSVLFLVGQVRPGEAPPKAMELKRLGALTAIALEILLLKNRLRSL
ncbi:MAG: hypothetical protein IPP07_25260 [Holophagales bacterium]|nr:hypothetical protein [Holophagales bacterium]MBK9967998.1 hypothetical protein [Holophagales bacterium]